MIVMERPDEFMDLFDLISIYGGLDEKIAHSIFVQIVNTVCSLYADYGVLHRDIKDENIIINMRTGEVILVDFGAATLISKTDVKEFQGTRSYCPPEWFKRVVYMPLEATVCYDNLNTPTEMLQLTDYEDIFEEGISSRRIPVDPDELSREMSMSQYYSAHESLGFSTDDSHPSQVDSSVTEDESRLFSFYTTTNN
uniref:Serine/threonine-protein kinase 1 n=1 Tax=Parascaris equorum TaxID=6256 RepID=A0A914RUR7_PAREQ